MGLISRLILKSVISKGFDFVEKGVNIVDIKMTKKRNNFKYYFKCPECGTTLGYSEYIGKAEIIKCCNCEMKFILYIRGRQTLCENCNLLYDNDGVCDRCKRPLKIIRPFHEKIGSLKIVREYK